MLLVYKKLHQLGFGALMEVYRESVAANGRELYPELSAGEQVLRAEQDFYAYLQQGFFTRPDDCYCIWEEQGQYVCALRLESYQDGLLLEALETEPAFRRRGFAQKLIRAVQEMTPGQKIYSHIHHENGPSISLHEKCGFRKISDRSRYADGSVNSYCGTYLYEAQNAGV